MLECTQFLAVATVPVQGSQQIDTSFPQISTYRGTIRLKVNFNFIQFFFCKFRHPQLLVTSNNYLAAVDYVYN